MIQRIAANGVELAYRFDGPEDAPVLMLSNSLMSNHTMWDSQIEALTASFRVLRYDTRGHGASAVPAGPYTMSMLGEDAAALMAVLGLERVHFMGLSMGGMIGQYLGANYGDRLKSLILCDTACVMPPRELWDDRVFQARKSGLGAAVEVTLGRWFTEPFRTPNNPVGNPVTEKIAEMIRTTDVEGFAGCCAAIRDMDQQPLLARIKVPTLVVVGELDPGTPIAAAEVLHAGIEGSELAVIPASAHLCNMERPDEFNRIVTDFLAKV
ncbi:MAG: 3-oxoadipate enol-lactonase [Rhodospirillaceae bacterium]